MQVITAVLDIRTSNYNTLIHTGIKYDVLINIIKRRLTIILVYYTNVLCREEKGCNNIINYGVVSNEISKHDFLYCTRKTKTVKIGKHNTVSIRSCRRYSKESLLERLRKKDLPEYFTFNCHDEAYTDLMAALQDTANEIVRMKDIR